MDMQNVKNLTIPEGSVKTIHDKDNRLLWGAVGYDTKYAGDTFQQTYTGKNLLNTFTFVKGRIDNGVIGYESGTTSITPTENSITFVTNQTFRGVVSSAIEVTASTDYALQFIYDSYEGYMSRTIHAYDENNDWISAVSITSNGIFTTPANCKYVRLNFMESAVGTAVIKNLQIEKGSTATSFEPYVGGTASPNPDYPQDIQVVTGTQTVTISDGNGTSASYDVHLGSTELCKIGTYQDYIYKSGDDWYMHKEVVKNSTLNTKNWSASGTQGDTTNGISFYNFDFNDKASGQVTLYCNYFTQIPSASGQDHTKLNFIISTSNDGIVINIKRSLLPEETTTGFKQWLSNNGVVLYYPIKTPTDSKITDSTLISQLNAVHQWLTRYGYNATVSGNLPIIIDRTNL